MDAYRTMEQGYAHELFGPASPQQTRAPQRPPPALSPADVAVADSAFVPVMDAEIMQYASDDGGTHRCGWLEPFRF